jgi:transketolase
MKDELKSKLEKEALKIRIGILKEMKALGFGHIGGSLSIADTLAVLYGEVMNVDVYNPDKPDRDKLVCSKGHAGPAIYSALANKGFFPEEDLLTLNKPGTNLPSHCDRNKTRGVDMTTGSLGQGTSLACGLALGDKLHGYNNRVYLIVGDGELDEGQVWEAAMFAAAKQLDNMVWLIDDNKKQLDGPTDTILPLFDIRAKFEAFGFDAVRINGNDVAAIYEVVTGKTTPVKPRAIILDTIKGCGVKEIEEAASNHSMNLPNEKWDGYLKGLESELAAREV